MSPIIAIPYGGFGEAAARHLQALRADCNVIQWADYKASPPIARIAILIASQPAPDVCQELGHHSGMPFIPAIIHSAILRIGPVIVPGRGGCWLCWTKRFKQHTAWLERQMAIWDHYTRHPDTGPSGFLEPFALMAAARLASIVEALDAEHQRAGGIWQINMLTRQVIMSTLIGIHGCDRCGLQRDPSTRSFADLKGALSSLWQS